MKKERGKGVGLRRGKKDEGRIRLGKLHCLGAAEVVRPVRPWPYQYLRPIIMGVAFCGCVSS